MVEQDRSRRDLLSTQRLRARVKEFRDRTPVDTGPEEADYHANVSLPFAIAVHKQEQHEAAVWCQVANLRFIG